jgi:hypothetical protein
MHRRRAPFRSGSRCCSAASALAPLDRFASAQAARGEVTARLCSRTVAAHHRLTGAHPTNQPVSEGRLAAASQTSGAPMGMATNHATRRTRGKATASSTVQQLGRRVCFRVLQAVASRSASCAPSDDHEEARPSASTHVEEDGPIPGLARRFEVYPKQKVEAGRHHPTRPSSGMQALQVQFTRGPWSFGPSSSETLPRHDRAQVGLRRGRS